MMDLTRNDELLIELLVDGELDEPQRKELLLRLDGIRNGWRFCALTFLETQCFGETLSRTDFLFAEPVNAGQMKSEVTETVVPGKSGTGPSKDAITEILSQTTASFGNTALASADLLDNGNNEDIGDNEYKGDIGNSENLNGVSAAADRDPLIIPLKKGGYRRRFSNDSSGGNSGGWRPVLLAMAGGFLLAAVLSGVLALLILDSNSVSSLGALGKSVGALNPSGTVASTETGTSASLNSESVNAAKPETFAAPHLNAARHPDSRSNSAPIRIVTLKSNNDNLNGIAVPCVESNTVPVSLKNLRQDRENRYVEDMRKKGHEVETVYEDLMFPLEDGRMLILPVDTFNVKYKNQKQYQ